LSYLAAPRTLGEAQRRFSNWSPGTLAAILALLVKNDVVTLSGAKLPVAVPGPETAAISAWLQLTNECNLACTYCFVRHNGNRMTPSMACQAVEAVYRSAIQHRCPIVELKYSGGEPTLNFSALEAAQKRAESLCNTTGIALKTVLLTNGTCLTDRRIAYLQEHDIGLMLSMDGLRPIHDSQRPYARGRSGSFARVCSGLDRLLKHGVLPYVSVTISTQNLGGLSELITYLIDRRVGFSLNFHRDVRPASGECSSGPTSHQLVEALRRALDTLASRLPRHNLLSTLIDRVDLSRAHTRSCGAGYNYMTIDCDGRISKCQMEMEAPLTTVAAPDPLGDLRTDARGIQNLPVDLKDCHDCVWRYRCAGGCPRLTFLRSQRYDARSPMCVVYRSVLPEVLRLETLRLLQFEQPWDFKVNQESLVSQGSPP
jgi:uncharacterized protein